MEANYDGKFRYRSPFPNKSVIPCQRILKKQGGLVMKKMVSVLLILTLILVVACGGGDDTEEPTTTPEPTQTETPTPTPEPTQTVTPQPTIQPTPTTTPEPTMEPSPTQPSDDDSVEAVLADVMPNLVVAFAEVDGTWQGYTGPNSAVLDTLESGKVYYWYATEDIALGVNVLSTMWNIVAWTSDSGSIADKLDGYEEAIPFVISPDVQAQQTFLYMSSAVEPLTVIPEGQTYTVVVVEPGDPRPNWSTHTR